MTSIEPFEIMVQLLGADGLCYKRSNIHATNSDLSTNGENKCGNSNSQEKLQKNYSKLINYLSCTDDIAAKLFQEGNIQSCQLEMIQNETNKIRKNELFLNAIQHSGGHVYDRFINALQETQQSCILRLLQEGIDFSLDHVERIQKNYIYLVENVDPMSGLLDKMLQTKSLTDREIEEIKSKDGSYRKNQELLSFLMRKSHNSFQLFIEALETTKQEYIAEQINLEDDTIQSVERTGDNSSNSKHHANAKSLHDLLKKGQSVRQLLGIKQFCTLPSEVQMCVSLKIINKIYYESNESCQMFYVRQTIKTLHEELNRELQTLQTIKTRNKELNRRIETLSKNEQNLTSELNGEKQRNKQLMGTIFGQKENLRKIEEEKDLIKRDRDLNRSEKQQRDAELENLIKELEKHRMEKLESLEFEKLLRHTTSKIEQENQRIRLSRELIENENCKISAEMEEVKNQLEIVRCDDEELKRIISRIEKERDLLSDSRDKIERDKNQLIAELHASKNHVEQCERIVEQINEQLSFIALEKPRVYKNRDSLLKVTRQLSTELNGLRNRLDIQQIIEDEKRYEAAKLEIREKIREISEIKQVNEIEKNKLNTELNDLRKLIETNRLDEKTSNKEITQNKSVQLVGRIIIAMKEGSLGLHLDGVYGVAWLEKKIYVVRNGSNRVHVFRDQDPYTQLKYETIEIKEMTVPWDMAASGVSRSIFISDVGSRCIWRIQMPSKKICRWKINGRPYGLSINLSDELIVVVDRDLRHYIDIYRCVDGERIKEIDVDNALNVPHMLRMPHAVQSSNGNFIIAHPSSDDGHRVRLISEVSIDGTKIIRSLDPGSIESNELKDWWPCHLSIDEDENIFVDDFRNDRVVLLNPRLDKHQILVNQDQHEIKGPMRICYVRKKRMLIVGHRGSVSLFLSIIPRRM